MEIRAAEISSILKQQIAKFGTEAESAEVGQVLAVGDAVFQQRCLGKIGEVARYIGRHGTKRVAKAVLIGAVPPLMLQTAANPGGPPMAEFDKIRAGVLADRSQFFKDLSGPFYGANRAGAAVSQGLRDIGINMRAIAWTTLLANIGPASSGLMDMAAAGTAVGTALAPLAGLAAGGRGG